MTPEFTSHLPIEPKSRSLRPARILAAAASALLLVSAIAPAAFAQTPTLLVLRAVPAAKGKKAVTTAVLPPLTQADIASVKIGGKEAPVTAFEPLLKGSHKLQLMVVLDSEQMLGAKGQFEDIENFLHGLPPNVVIGVGWLLQGNVKVVQDFTTDRELVYKAFVPQTREQAANPKNDNGNEFACLRWLSSHWPGGADPQTLKAVLMFSDGIIRNNGQSQGGDQLNPDVEGASQSLQRASIIPYPFYWLDPIVPDPNRNEGGSLEGQQNFSQLTTNTGGAPLYDGMFAPGTLTPLLNKLYSILASEAVVTVSAPYKPGKFERLDLKSPRDDIDIHGPDNVMVGNVPLR